MEKQQSWATAFQRPGSVFVCICGIRYPGEYDSVLTTPTGRHRYQFEKNRLAGGILVGVKGIEPPKSWSQTKRLTIGPHPVQNGADNGNRTRVPSLGSSYSTIELYPHMLMISHFLYNFKAILLFF